MYPCLDIVAVFAGYMLLVASALLFFHPPLPVPLPVGCVFCCGAPPSSLEVFVLPLALPLVLDVALPLTVAVVTLGWACGSEFCAAATKALSSGRGPFPLGIATFVAFYNPVSSRLALF